MAALGYGGPFRHKVYIPVSAAMMIGATQHRITPHCANWASWRLRFSWRSTRPIEFSDVKLSESPSRYCCRSQHSSWADKPAELIDRDDDNPVFDEDSHKQLAIQFQSREPMRPLNGVASIFVTMNGKRVRITADELAHLPSVWHCVVGEEHFSVHRKIVSRLWPDLIAEFMLGTNMETAREANRRFKEWTGMRFPECHRDWRALAEWADLCPPDTLTEDWLLDFLEPRLWALWKRQHSIIPPDDLTPASPKKTRHSTRRGRQPTPIFNNKGQKLTDEQLQRWHSIWKNSGPSEANADLKLSSDEGEKLRRRFARQESRQGRKKKAS